MKIDFFHVSESTKHDYHNYRKAAWQGAQYCEQGTRICGVKSHEKRSIRGRHSWASKTGGAPGNSWEDLYRLTGRDGYDFDEFIVCWGATWECEGRTNLDYDNTALTGLKFKCCPKATSETGKLSLNSKMRTPLILS